MKRNIVLLSILLSLLNCFGATWTFHSFKDNYVGVSIGETFSGNPWHHVDFVFDAAWDAALPSSSDSGLYWWDSTTTIIPQAETLSAVVGDDWWMTSFYVAQGYPDYNGSWSGVQRPDLAAGEYWIDFASDGSYRISSVQPVDFGKWAWDGSVNPNYVEPLVLAKSRARKQRK